MSSEAALSLVQLPPGDKARVLQVPPGPLQVRLASLGLVVGATIELLQSTPAVLVRVGATSLALERELGALILIQSQRDETRQGD